MCVLSARALVALTAPSPNTCAERTFGWSVESPPPWLLLDLSSPAAQSRPEYGLGFLGTFKLFPLRPRAAGRERKLRS